MIEMIARVLRHVIRQIVFALCTFEINCLTVSRNYGTSQISVRRTF